VIVILSGAKDPSLRADNNERKRILRSFLPQEDTAYGNNVFAAWAVFNGFSVVVKSSFSHDAGATWSKPTILSSPSIDQPQNTSFRDGIDDYFPVSPFDGSLLLAYQDFNLQGTGTTDIFAMISKDGGLSWSAPILVNDDPNTAATDELQPAIAASPTGRIAVSFYDRRLPCPTNDSNIIPAHFGATNFCVNTSVQFYNANLVPIGHNVRASARTWDPEQQRVTTRGGLGFIGDYFGLAMSATRTFVLNVSTADLGANPNHFQQQILQTLDTP
jgi:hypothetical protein